jgi:hypothetical protein
MKFLQRAADRISHGYAMLIVYIYAAYETAYEWFHSWPDLAIQFFAEQQPFFSFVLQCLGAMALIELVMAVLSNWTKSKWLDRIYRNADWLALFIAIPTVFVGHLLRRHREDRIREQKDPAPWRHRQAA